jgi:NhaA family Na+:H+ antiporter
VALALLNIFNVRRIGIYILVGLVLWTAVLKSAFTPRLRGLSGLLYSVEGEDGSPARQ